jgi:CelD/BcsL family acetyltransferase involved in cellulose biosynthesis
MRASIDDPRWLSLVASCPDAGPFHHPAWATLVSETYRFPTFVLALADPAGRLVAGLPVVELRWPLGLRRRWIALPFTDACPPLLTDDLDPGLLVRELDTARVDAGIKSLEVRGALPGYAAVQQASAVVHRLCLDSDPDIVSRRFRSNFRRNIRRAGDHGVTVRRSTSWDDVVTVFYGLHLRTRRRQGIPVQPRRFFRHMWRLVIDAGLGFVAIAEADNRPLAAAVFLSWKDTIVYKYGASDPAFLSVHPNHRLFGEVIAWACRNDYSVFDFGRTDYQNEGLRSFKSGWGATEEALVYTTLGEPRVGMASRRAAMAQPVLQRGPLWLTRGLGEVLYRYFG